MILLLLHNSLESIVSQDSNEAITKQLTKKLEAGEIGSTRPWFLPAKFADAGSQLSQSAVQIQIGTGIPVRLRPSNSCP